MSNNPALFIAFLTVTPELRLFPNICNLTSTLCFCLVPLHMLFPLAGIADPTSLGKLPVLHPSGLLLVSSHRQALLGDLSSFCMDIPRPSPPAPRAPCLLWTTPYSNCPPACLSSPQDWELLKGKHCVFFSYFCSKS